MQGRRECLFRVDYGLAHRAVSMSARVTGRSPLASGGGPSLWPTTSLPIGQQCRKGCEIRGTLLINPVERREKLLRSRGAEGQHLMPAVLHRGMELLGLAKMPDTVFNDWPEVELARRFGCRPVLESGHLGPTTHRNARQTAPARPLRFT